MDFNLKHFLEINLPIIFELLVGNELSNSQWQNLSRKFNLKHQKRIAEYNANNNYLLVERNLYDLILSSLKGELQSSMFFSFIKKVLEELTDNLSIDERKKLRKTIFDFLVSFDAKYYNYLGELLVLNNLLSNPDYELLDIEVEIINNKSADFLIGKKNSNETHLVEVVSIHIGDEHNDLEKAIQKKLSKKVLSKTDGIKSHRPFILIPVVWASYKNLRRIEKWYTERSNSPYPNVKELTAFAMFTYDNNKTFYRYGNISTLFNIPNEHLA